MARDASPDPSDATAALRARAEELLANEGADPPDPAPAALSAEATANLLHELRTHRIELELQNEDLRAAQIELARACDRYRDLFDFAPVGYVDTDALGIVQHANLTFADMVGVERRALVRARFFSEFIHPDDEACWLQHRSRGPEAGPRSCELRLRSASGEDRWVRLDSVVRSVEGGEGHLRTAITDISVSRRAEAARAELTRAAREASRAKAEFVANMSHEIRTPLNGVLGGAPLLQLTELDSEQQDLVATLIRSGDHLLSIVDLVLDFSNLDSQTLELESVPVDLRVLIEGVIADHRPAADRKGLALDARIRAGVPEVVVGDPARLRQVLSGLIDNAVKFTDAGSVTVSASWEEDLCRFAVRDTGIGVAADMRDQVFEAFTQAESDTARRFGGTGLGLAIASQLAALMGGTTGLDDIPGGGSRFWFTATLPPCRPEALPAAETVASCPGRVLIVDDDIINLTLHRRMIEMLGHQVDTVDNGFDAVQLSLDQPYDIVLMDCQMPRMDGYEATRAIRRREEEGEHLVVVAVSASVTASDRARCIDAGMDDHVGKPVSLTRFSRLLAEWLGTPGGTPPRR